MEPKSIGLLVHSYRADRLEEASKAIACLRANGISVFVEQWLAQEMEETLSILGAPVDAIIALGGDGTLLRAAKYAIEWDIPLLGINLGRIGFLTEVEQESLGEAIGLLATGRFEIEPRMLLDVMVEGKKPIRAINDAVISRSGYARLVSIDASISGELIGTYRADGLIVSSPTGSTGYSLSAGGPIVSPDVQCMIISPICAHSLQHRPVVVSAKETIHLHLGCDQDRSLALVVDGMEPVMLKCGTQVHIKKSDATLKLIRFDTPHFFTLVRSKLNEWTR